MKEHAATTTIPTANGCRRNKNCVCKTCISSIISTLDLLPTFTAQKPSLIKIKSLSSNSNSPPETPKFFTSSNVSTPDSTNSKNHHHRLRIKKLKKTELLSFLKMLVKCALIMMLVLILRPGSLFNMMEIKVSDEKVTNLSEKSRLGFADLKDKFGVLRNALKEVVGDDDHGLVTNPTCHIIQDGLILRSSCQLYQSGSEEVSVWGWPYQTTGLVKTEFDSRSFTVLSGRVTEWSNGVLSCLIRQANTSWEQGKWITYVWRLDENTWILEYKRSFLFDNTHPFSSAMEFLKYKMMRALQWMKKLWNLSDGIPLAPT
uniref:uncharacterized protein LOC122596500 n=1 Tax=Erigeron canadensis TaxID=72917 RepID=UPI001CB9860F|nr:uncharacterized protein LOC122596500 [Erigeron canadensis]